MNKDVKGKAETKERLKKEKKRKNEQRRRTNEQTNKKGK